MTISAPTARPVKITVNTRANDGAPACQWRAEIWVVAGRLEIDIFKNDQLWGQEVQPGEVLATLGCAGSHKAHRYVARKITALAAVVSKTHCAPVTS